MARRCGCASDECSCAVTGGDGIIVTGAGSPRNPYVVTSTVAQIETGFDVQYNNVDIIHDVHQIDFRGTAVSVTPGADEIVVTVNQPDPVSGYTVPSGAMWMFGGATAPSGWLVCDGALLLIADYPNLFGAISNRYGGDGTVNFRVPNMMGKFPLGIDGTHPASEQGGGDASKSISASNMPPHTHSINHQHPAFNTGSGGGHYHDVPMSNTTGSNNTQFARGAGNNRQHPTTTNGEHVHSIGVPNFGGSSGSAGSGTPLDVMPPWIAMLFIIKT